MPRRSSSHLALAGCTQGTTAHAGARYAPYSSDNNGIRPGHGRGDGVGDGGMQPAWWGEVDPLLSPSSHLDARAAAGFKLHLVKRALPPGRAMPPVRRLTAILAADVAGYSRLMGGDEEGTHARLKVHLAASWRGTGWQ
jgi:hypothetical protein